MGRQADGLTDFMTQIIHVFGNIRFTNNHFLYSTVSVGLVVFIESPDYYLLLQDSKKKLFRLCALFIESHHDLVFKKNFNYAWNLKSET
jgi:hypothetical protein